MQNGRCWYATSPVVCCGMPLTDLTCRSIKAQPTVRKLSDMGGLQLWVFPTGSKLWRLAYRFNGKQKLLALGRYPETKLPEARAKRDEAKALIKEGTDPSAARKQERIEHMASNATFDVVADEYLEKQRRQGRAPATMTKPTWLRAFARPTLGAMHTETIRPIDVLSVLRKVEA